MCLVKINHVSKRFGGRTVLRNVHLNIIAGDRLVLAGTNGAGKSTVLSLVAGILEPDGGTVETPPGKNTTIGYAPEHADLPDHLTVQEWFDLVASLKRCPRLLPANLERWGLSYARHTRMSALSAGQRQRVSLLAALTGSPTLVVLDEPTNALDAGAVKTLVAALTRVTFLVATHDTDFANRLHARNLSLDQGCIASSP